ncbi:TolC family protein [Methyloversatilis discipulorum]|nr:TolC family protein [Methyloversatilis discipulorum]MBL8467749.1 TolC family protein [Methyloversatilis discipulorum]
MQALSSAPSSLEQIASVEATRSDALQARAWQNPRIEALVENLNAPAADGTSQRQNTYSINQPLELFGKRQARLDVADRNVDTAVTRSRQLRVAFSVELAYAYALAEAAIQRSSLASEELNRANDDLRAALAFVEAGREASLRAAQARASVAAALATERAAKADVVQALEMLSALSGAQTPFQGLGASLLDVKAPVPVSLDAYETPAVVTARAERDVLRAQVEVERKRMLPDVSVSAGARRYGFIDTTGYQIGVSLSVPIFDRNSSGIDAAEYRVAAAEARLNNLLLQSQAQRRSALAQVEAADQRLSAAKDGEEAATEAYRLGRIGYDAGRTPLIELLAARRALNEARLTTLEARLSRVRAIALLEQSEGRLAFAGEQAQ